MAGDWDNSSVLFVTFNQDLSSLSVGTTTGYKLFNLNSIDKLELLYEGTDVTDINRVERLFSSSLVALVSLNAPRKLKVCHFKKGTEICNYSYGNTILGVRLNRQRLVVCLEESLYIHNIRDMKVLHTIKETPPNPRGVCALSAGLGDESAGFLAYPGSSQIGEIQVFDTVDLRAVTMILAHDNPLAALAFDASGTRLASASEKGTVIRVFAVPSGDKLFEFRRGMKRCVSINCLCFSADALLLAASSNTETIHIFKLETQRDKPAEEPQTFMDYFSKAVVGAASYLPTQAADAISQVRDFATAKLPVSGPRNVCAIATIGKACRLVVAATDGCLYIYNVDTAMGGECVLVKQHRIDGGKGECWGESPMRKPSQSGATTYPGQSAAATTYPGQSAAATTYPGQSAPATYSAATGQRTLSPRKREPSPGDAGCLRLDDENEFPPMTHQPE